MDLAEAIVKYLVADALEHCADDLEFFDKFVDKGLRERLEFVVERPVRAHHLHRGRRDPARQRARRSSIPVEYGLNLQSEHERWLTEEHFKSPVTVFNYPKEIKPFYMRLNDDGKTVDRDGPARARHRRDHRRQPARGAARRAAGEHARSTGSSEEAYWLVCRPAPIRHACRTPASASASSACSCSSPACRTSATSSPSPARRGTPNSKPPAYETHRLPWPCPSRNRLGRAHPRPFGRG